MGLARRRAARLERRRIVDARRARCRAACQRDREARAARQSQKDGATRWPASCSMSTTAKLHDGGAEGASLARVTEAPGPVPTYYEIREGGGGVADFVVRRDRAG